MPPKRAGASKRKAAAVEDDDAAPAASPAAASRSAKKQGGSKGAKAARKSKDADAEDEEDGAAADMADAAPSSSSSSSSSAAAAAAPAPKLKGKAAKFAAALAASAFAPINRCDADSISVVFSFLNTREFLAAVAVSRAFRAARMKHTAWPKLNLSSFIQSLRDDNYSDNARRRLDMQFELGSEHRLRLASVALGRGLEQVRAEVQRVYQIRADHASAVVKAKKTGAPLPELPVDLHRMLTTPAAAGAADSCPSMWCHVTDIRLRVASSILWGDGARDLEVALHQLTLFPYASAINISAGCTDSYDHSDNAWTPRAECVRQMYERLTEAQRVEAMLLFAITRPFLDGLPLLSSTLKVLVLDRQPAPVIISALVHLVYLHFESGSLHGSAADQQAISAELGMALRWLSVSHALRSLSVAKGGFFYSAGLNFVIVPPFIAGATPEQGGPTGDTQSNVALAAAKAEIARPPDSTLPRVDWSKSCGLTDITLTGGLHLYQLCWLSRLPLVRLELGPAPAPRQMLVPLDPAAVMQPVSGFANLQALRLEMDGQQGCSGFTMSTLRQCNKLRVLQLSSIDVPRWRTGSKMQQTALSSVLRSNAETLEELRVGANLPVAWDAPEPQWALGRSNVVAAAASVTPVATGSATAGATAAAASSASAVAAGSSMPDAAGEAASAAAVPAAAAAVAVVAPSDLPALAAREWPSVLMCTRLRVVELVNASISPSFVAALACLPAFHTLELINAAAQFSLPSNLAACVSHSRSWSCLCLTLHESSPLNLLRISGGLNKLMPTEQLSEAAVHRLRVYGFKEEERQVLAVQTDKKGVRKWASIEGPFATAVV